jgi:hypothetical protein
VKILKIPGSGGTPVLQDVKHTWDANANMPQRQDLITSETENFTYDPLDRLMIASGPYSEAFTYNETGNITSKNGDSYTYGENGAGPHAVTKVGLATYTYDANGNMNVGTARTWDVYPPTMELTHDRVRDVVSE